MIPLVVAASTGLIHSSAAAPLLTPPQAWDAQLGLLRHAGYVHVDLSDFWVPLGELDWEGVARLQDALASTGMTAIGASVIGVELANPERREESLRWAGAALANSARLGLPHMSVGLHPKGARAAVPGSRPNWVDAPRPAKHTDEQFQSVASDMRHLADRAADLGMDLSLEMHERTLVDTAANCRRLLEMIGRENVGVNPDLGNLIRCSWPMTETWFETLERVAPFVRYWHVKNAVRIDIPGAGAATAFASLEAGTIDYRAAVALVTRSGYRGPLVVEHYGGDVLAFATGSRRYLRELLGDAEAAT